jgi:hypothetical protein
MKCLGFIRHTQLLFVHELSENFFSLLESTWCRLFLFAKNWSMNTPKLFVSISVDGLQFYILEVSIHCLHTEVSILFSFLSILFSFLSILFSFQFIVLS